MLRGSVVNQEPLIAEEALPMPTLMRVMEDVFISSVNWLRRSPNKVIRMGITHIVIPENLVDCQMRDMFQVFTIPALIKDIASQKSVPTSSFSVMPGVMDFLR